MAIVSHITKTVEIPNEDVTAVIRKLNHTQLKLAAKMRQSDGVAFMREMGGELIKAMRDADGEKIKQLQDAQEADVKNYDRDTLLKTGVVSWTYDQKLPDGTDDLDEATAKFLADQIFQFSRPDTKAEAKNV